MAQPKKDTRREIAHYAHADKQRLNNPPVPRPEIAALIEELKGPNIPTSRIAINTIAEFGPEAEIAVPALINILKGDNQTLRGSAINALGKIGPRANTAIPALINTFNEGNLKLSRMSGNALLLIDPEAVTLVEALNRAEPGIRKGAAYALEHISPGAKAAVSTLIKALEHADVNVQQSIVKAVSRIGSPAVPALIEAVKVKNVGRNAITALAMIGPQAGAAVAALAEIVREADSETSLEAIDALGKIGPAALSTLTDALFHSLASVRRRAASALATMRAEAKASVPALIRALRDPEMGKEAAYALGEIGPDAYEAIPALISLLNEKDQDFRRSTVYALSEIGSTAVPALIQALSHSEGGIREAAADALARIGPDAQTSVSALTEALKDKLESVRSSAARAIIAIITDTETKVKILLKALADEDKGVRDSAAKIIAEIGSSAVPTLIYELSTSIGLCRGLFNEYIVNILVRMGQRAVSNLIEALRDEEEDIRDNAANILRLIVDELNYIRVITDPWKDPIGYEINYKQLDEERLQELLQTSPNVLERLYYTDLQYEGGQRVEYLTGPPPLSERYNELREMITKRQALITEISSALDKPIQHIEPQRYTDLTMYVGHLYPSDDLETATRLADNIPLVAGETYTLGVAIRLKRTGMDADREAPRAVKNPRRAKEDLTVYVLASPDPEWTGIDIRESFAKITWPYNVDSESALFRLDVKRVEHNRTSQGAIEVRLYDSALDLLDIVKVCVTVVPHNLQTSSVPARLVLWPDEEEEPQILHIDPKTPMRYLSIHVTPISTGYRFDFIFSTQNGDIKIAAFRDIHTMDLEKLLVKVRDFWTELVITNYASQLSVTRTTFVKYLNQLRDLGVEAWSLLFGTRYADQAGAPERLGELLATMQLSEGTHIQITYSKGYSDFIFPWSILYPPTEDTTAVDPLRFWGARYQIEQVTAGPRRDKLTDEPISVLFALDEGFGNSASQIELLKKYQTAGGSRLLVSNPISDQRTLFNELERNPSAHLLYFYCHGYAWTEPGSLHPDGVQLLKQRIEALPADTPERQALETLLTLTAKMGNESWMYIGNSEIKESTLKHRKFFEKRRPIVFLNMCQSATLLPSMSSGLVRVFLDHNASAVVGTESPMTAVFASAFAEAVLDALLGGDDIGTALWKARRRFLGNETRNPLGLAYTLYGRAVARLGTSPLMSATMTPT